VDSHDWDERYSGSEFEWTTQPSQFVVRELAELPPGRALDLASGEGRNAVWLAERGWRVTGVDFSRVGVGKARRFAARRGVDVEWILADLTSYQPPVGTFGLVLVAYLQLPASQRAEVLARAASALAVGGTFLMVGHDLTNLTEGVGGPRSAEVLCTPEVVSAELVGLRVRRAERVRRTVRHEREPFDAIDTLVLATKDPGS
jgi:SAM-dependent methyltransferase